MARVLVVEDDTAALEIRKLLLERKGHQVAVADSAEEARALFPELVLDVVLMDLRLPLLEDGLALIREFYAADVRIVVLCGNPADLDGRAEGRMVARVLGKPVRSEVLMEAVS